MLTRFAVFHYSAAFRGRKIFFLLSGQLEIICEIMQTSKKTEEGFPMRGYFTAGGFYGLVDGRYLLFSDESEYYEYLREED